MKYLTYILASVMILISMPVYAADGQLIIREYYRDANVQPYVIKFDIIRMMNDDRKKATCRRAMKSIMSAYNVYYGNDLVYYDFFETKYVCLDSDGDRLDSGYYYVIPMHSDLETSCKITWEQKFMRYNLENKCYLYTNFKIERFEKALLKNYITEE